MQPLNGLGGAWHKCLEEWGGLALLSMGPDRQQRGHQHQPQLILSVPACRSQAGSEAKDYIKITLLIPVARECW